MIRTAKFSIPASLQPEFEEVMNKKSIKGLFTPTKNDMCMVEVTYTKSQTGIIDDIEDAITVLTALALICASTFSEMILKAQLSQDKK